MSLEILYEDEWLVAVNKPAGLVVHPTYKNVSGTLLDQLRARDPQATFSLVGRLDKLTSGIVVVATSGSVHTELQRIWPSAEKDYLAIVKGRVEPARGEINLPLGTDPADRRRRIVRADGAPSITQYERVAGDGNCSILRCRPVTGRRHQIRVHLAAHGWPVLGDAVYGPPGSARLHRHALHALRLILMHPITATPLRIETRIPDDLISLITATGLRLTSHLQL